MFFRAASELRGFYYQPKQMTNVWEDRYGYHD
jgi:hypothetical protein